MICFVNNYNIHARHYSIENVNTYYCHPYVSIYFGQSFVTFETRKYSLASGILTMT